MIQRRSLSVFVAVMLTLTIIDVAAAETEREHPEGADSHRHSMELFLGNTNEESEDAFTIGLGYEYRLEEHFGVGFLVEGIAGDLREWIIGVPLFIHPYKDWRFVLAPGVQHSRDTKEEELLFRVGAAYEFEVGRLSITPAFNVDFVNNVGEVYVFGVGFGWGF